MKLSEAIRLGIGAVENDASVFLITPENGQPYGCALGAALYAIGETSQAMIARGEMPSGTCKHFWPWSDEDLVAEISCRHTLGESRESIAAWVETIEPQDDQAPVLPDVCDAESRA